MYTSGMSPVLGITFAAATVMIAIPSAVKVFNWLGTLWGGRIQMTTPLLFGLGFVSMFIIGGLSGILMASTPVDIVIHDTYYIVAHFHYVLVGAATMAIFGGIYFWYPKMFGRMMNEFWGKVHFALTFIFINGTFFPMHLLGAGNMPRRYADPYHFELFADMQPLNQFISICAFASMAAQMVFVLNFLTCLFWGSAWGATLGIPILWNGRHPAHRATAILISSRLFIADRTNMEIQPPAIAISGLKRNDPLDQRGRRITNAGLPCLPTAGYSRTVHAFAVALVLSVFPLIWVGSLVTTYDAGMAVPDWPTTYGYNMFLYPLQTWLYGPFDLLAET